MKRVTIWPRPGWGAPLEGAGFHVIPAGGGKGPRGVSGLGLDQKPVLGLQEVLSTHMLHWLDSFIRFHRDALSSLLESPG